MAHCYVLRRFIFITWGKYKHGNLIKRKTEVGMYETYQPYINKHGKNGYNALPFAGMAKVYLGNILDV